MKRYGCLFFIILLSLLLSSINFNYGIAESEDFIFILRRAEVFLTRGYQPSRAFGFPLYEFFIYPIIVYGGTGFAKAFSLIWYILSGMLFFKIIRHLTKEWSIAFIGTCCFILHPLSIISGNTMMEFSLGIFLALGALYYFLQFQNQGKPSHLYCIALCCGLATAARPDYVIFSSSIAMTLLYFKKLHKGQIFVATLIYLFAVGMPYLLLYGPHYFTQPHLLHIPLEPWFRKLAKALFGYLALFGLPTSCLIVILLLKNIFHLNHFRNLVATSPVAFLFFSSFVLYFISFALAPEKLEYVFVIIPLFILWVFTLFRSKIVLLTFLITIALPNIIQIHFFKREGRTIKINLGFSPGAIVQDRSERLKNEYIYFGNLWKLIQTVAREKFGCDNYLTSLPRSAKVDECIIVPEDKLRFWNPDRLPPGVRREELLQNKIIVYPLPYHSQWRKFYQFTPFRNLYATDFKIYSERPYEN